MELVKVMAIFQVLMASPQMSLSTSGTFAVRGDKLECVVGRLRLVETRRAIRITCEP